MRPEVTAFFHQPTSTFSYIVACERSRRAAVVDPVLDYDPAAARTGTQHADAIIARLRESGLGLDWILETHAHADHLSAAKYIQRETGGTLAIGEGIRQVQAVFSKLFNLPRDFPVDGSQFDRLFADGETFRLGEFDARALHTPGHTSDSMTYVIGDAAFVGDTLFMPDGGTARCDFPGGSAPRLYESIQRIYGLPADTRLFMCHDYAPGGREYRHATTVGEQRRANIHIHDGVAAEEFAAMREARDRRLGVPALLLPAIQFNIRGGAVPDEEGNGIAYFRIPLNRF